MDTEITFDDPPLAEVLLGCSFLPRPDLLVPHFGVLWERLKGQFPEVAHANQVVAPGEVPLVNEDGIMLPRVWYISRDKRYLLQLQQNRFYYNWRKTDSEQYVRFNVIQSEAIRLWHMFSEYVIDALGTPIQPILNELSYTNIFGIDGKDAFALMNETLRDATWSAEPRFLQKPVALGHNYSFTLPNGVGELEVAVSTGSSARTGAALLKMDLSVKGKHSDGGSLEEWSTRAHDFLVRAFKDLTSPAMHKRWKLRNV